MDKKTLIKPAINFFKNMKRCLLIDTNNTPGIPLLLLKILVKENTEKLSIAFVSPSEIYFKEIFPKMENNIKPTSLYSLGQHSISFYVFDKTLLKSPPSNIDILFLYPLEGLKEKEVLKFNDNIQKVKKLVLISNSPIDKLKILKKLDPTVLSLRPSDDTAYYEKMKQKIYDFK